MIPIGVNELILAAFAISWIGAVVALCGTLARPEMIRDAILVELENGACNEAALRETVVGKLRVSRADFCEVLTSMEDDQIVSSAFEVVERGERSIEQVRVYWLTELGRRL